MSLRKITPVKPAKRAQQKHQAPKPGGRKPAKKPQRQHRRPIGG